MPKKGELKITLPQLTKQIDDYLKECKANAKIPFLVGLANKMGVDATTLSRYSEENKIYAKLLKKVKQHTEEALLDKGLVENKPVMSIFLLKALAGYSETQRLDITSNGESIGVVQLPPKISGK